MSPDEQLAAVTAERDELLAMVRAVVNGVESVSTDDGGALISTRLPKGVFGRMVQVSEASE